MMKPFIRNVYLQEILSQCILAHRAIEDMCSLVVEAHIGTEAPRFWYCLQAFLASAANISKLLWPSRGDAKRGHELRALLEIDDKSPLRVRDLRNDIEHLDERLDVWAQASEVSGDLELSVRIIEGGPASMFGLDTKKCFLYFDASSYKITVADQEYEILPISWAIHELAKKVEETLNTPPTQGGVFGGNR